MKRFGVIAGKKEFDCGTTRCWLHSCLGSMQKSGVRGNDQGVRIERKARGPTFVVYGSAEQTRRQVSVRRPRKVCRESLQTARRTMAVRCLPDLAETCCDTTRDTDGVAGTVWLLGCRSLVTAFAPATIAASRVG